MTPEQSDKLKLLHERTKVPVAVYIREGIDLVLRHYGHLLPGQLPLDGSSSMQQANGRSAPARQETASDTDDNERGHESPLRPPPTAATRRTPPPRSNPLPSDPFVTRSPSLRASDALPLP